MVHLKSLKRKFSFSEEETNPDVLKFIIDLLMNGEAEVPGGPKSQIGLKICSFFSEAQKVKFVEVLI